jgi:two-component system cell cycle sensor histidine kinase/response regulator CckA
MSADPVELLRAEARRAEARRRTDALALFSRRMAHDLSNLLTIIRTYAELVLADTPASSPSHADLTEIGQAADMTVAYLQRTSAFGRAAGAPVAPVRLDALVAAVVAEAEAAGRGPFTVHRAADVEVTASVAGLSDALLELVANARDADPDGTIALRTRAAQYDTPAMEQDAPIGAGRWAVIEVVDTGPGLADGVADNPFDPFVTTKAGVRGAGLGLSIARSHVWAAGGELVLTRDRGSTVARLYLPITDTTAR